MVRRCRQDEAAFDLGSEVKKSADRKHPAMPRFDTLTPEQLEQLVRIVEGGDTVQAVSDDLREIVEKHWPELVPKLPPRTQQ